MERISECDYQRSPRVAIGGKRHAIGRTSSNRRYWCRRQRTRDLPREKTFGPVAPVFRFRTEGEVVEGFFSTITRRKIRRGVFKSVADLGGHQPLHQGAQQNVQAVRVERIARVDLQKLAQIPEPSEWVTGIVIKITMLGTHRQNGVNRPTSDAQLDDTRARRRLSFGSSVRYAEDGRPRRVRFGHYIAAWHVRRQVWLTQ